MYRSKYMHPARLGVFCAVLMFAWMPDPVSAEDIMITPFVGYRGGGDVEDVITGSKVDIDESGTQGVIVGWEMDSGEFEIIYSRQATALTAGGNVAPSVLVDVEISQLLASGKSIMDPELGSYLAFMLGVTHFDFDGPEFDTDTRFALGFGSGIEYPLSKRLGLRVGLHGVFTHVDTEADAVCATSTNCPINARSMFQWELFSGLTFRF